MTNRKTYIVGNVTEGYGYHYASLSDIARQGISIPVMKTGTDELNGKDYIYYYDEEFNEWIRGAEIVIHEAKGMNDAQRYASAVTYARRVTTQLARCIACSDDEDVENTDSKGEMKMKTMVNRSQSASKPKEKVIDLATTGQLTTLEGLLDPNNKEVILNAYKISELRMLTKEQASKCIAQLKKMKEAKDNGE